MEIKWNKSAIEQLLDIIQFLEKNDFEEYARKVNKEILIKIKQLPETFQHHSLDRYKLNNDGSFVLLNLIDIVFHSGLTQQKSGYCIFDIRADYQKNIDIQNED